MEKVRHLGLEDHERSAWYISLRVLWTEREARAVHRPDGLQDALRDTLPRRRLLGPGLREAERRGPAEVVLHFAHPRSCGDRLAGCLAGAMVTRSGIVPRRSTGRRV
jgi:hypothetical protein